MVNYREPLEAANDLGKIEKSNYLAHSIRKIERLILKEQQKHYHIITYVTKTDTQKSKITFYDKCCEIRLPTECENIDDKQIRLTLAHELGHLIFNIKKLTNPEILENTFSSNEEEMFAWEFAYNLILAKSDEHRINNNHRKFIYDKKDLKQILSAMIKKKKPEIHKEIVSKLDL